MPNWCMGEVFISGLSSDVEEFCKYFLFEDDVKKDKYFARSFIHLTWEDFKKEYLGADEISISVDFAWSATSCLFPDGYPKDSPECITLMDACKKHKVSVTIDTEEPGMCFEEHIEVNENGELVADECNDMPTFICSECGNEQSIPSSFDIKDEECYECEKIVEWRTKDEAIKPKQD